MGQADINARVGELEVRVERLESQFVALDGRITKDLDNLGSYKTRTKEELTEIQGQLSQIVGTLEALVGAGENREDLGRASALLRRARNNLTRASNQLKAG